MSQANFSLVLNAEARYAAQQMEQELNIPFIELARVFRLTRYLRSIVCWVRL